MIEIATTQSVVHLERLGSIKVFRIVFEVGDIEDLATNDLTMDEMQMPALAERCWAVKDYHRNRKRGTVSDAFRRSQKNHMELVIEPWHACP